MQDFHNDQQTRRGPHFCRNFFLINLNKTMFVHAVRANIRAWAQENANFIISGHLNL